MFLLLNSILAGFYFVTLVLASSHADLCKDAPNEALRCCDADSWTRCWGSHLASDCQPVPIAGSCENNKLNITHPDAQMVLKIANQFGIKDYELTDPDSISPSVFEASTATSRVPNAERGAHKTTKKPTPTKMNKNLGLSNVPQTSGPPKACQVIGNVVLDRCDYDEAMFDHWLGDDPCDYGCPTSAS